MAGESVYQDALIAASGGSYSQGVLRPIALATLRRDPKNLYDENAVAVLIHDRLVGHLPRATAPQVQASSLSSCLIGRAVLATAGGKTAMTARPIRGTFSVATQ